MNDLDICLKQITIGMISIIIIMLIIFFIKLYMKHIPKIDINQKKTISNENMPYILLNEDMPFHISNFNDNQHELQFKEGVAIFPDKGIIILKMPENVKIIVEQEGMK